MDMAWCWIKEVYFIVKKLQLVNEVLSNNSSSSNSPLALQSYTWVHSGAFTHIIHFRFSLLLGIFLWCIFRHFSCWVTLQAFNLSRSLDYQWYYFACTFLWQYCCCLHYVLHFCYFTCLRLLVRPEEERAGLFVNPYKPHFMLSTSGLSLKCSIFRSAWLEFSQTL